MIFFNWILVFEFRTTPDFQCHVLKHLWVTSNLVWEQNISVTLVISAGIYLSVLLISVFHIFAYSELFPPDSVGV